MRASDRSTPAEILRAAYEASGRTQIDFARDVLGMSVSGFGKWVGGQPCPPAIVRLCWAIVQRPELADEIEAEFNNARPPLVPLIAKRK